MVHTGVGVGAAVVGGGVGGAGVGGGVGPVEHWYMSFNCKMSPSEKAVR